MDVADLGADLAVAAMAKLSEIYKFSLIEDAAHTLGSFYQTGEGRAVMTNDRQLTNRVRCLRVIDWFRIALD